jgi:hypothetical protein
LGVGFFSWFLLDGWMVGGLVVVLGWVGLA